MPKFSQRSRDQLESCDHRLVTLFDTVVLTYDCSVLEGYRDEDLQNWLFNEGRTKLRWPKSKHNNRPSWAIDVAPYPIDWVDRERFYHFAGFVQGTAQGLKLEIRWGGDWDRDKDFRDQSFDDLVHYELVLK